MYDPTGPPPVLALPAIVASADDQTRTRFLEFFAVTIRNPHTRRAYMRATGNFFAWVTARSVSSPAAVSRCTWRDESKHWLAR